jgi:acyl-CoA thioester hydrolase
MTVEYGYLEPVTVHFDDLDAMGMVHNARYALLVERAYIAYWTRQGFGYSGPSSPPDAFAVVGEFSISYHVPVCTVGELKVHMWTERLGNSSATIGFRILSADGETVHAAGTRVHIKLDPATLRPAPWTDEARTYATAVARPGSDL